MALLEDSSYHCAFEVQLAYILKQFRKSHFSKIHTESNLNYPELAVLSTSYHWKSPSDV